VNGTHAGTVGETGGAFGLVKIGAGVLTLSGTNTYSGGTTISNGAVQIQADANLGDTAGRLTFDGGMLSTRGTFGIARPITLNADGGILNPETGTTLTVSGPITGPGALTIFQTSYNFPPSPPGPAVLVLSGDNSYTGGTNINAAVVAVSSNANLGDPNGALRFNGGTLQYLSSFDMARPTVLIGNYTQNATVDTNGHSGTWAGPVSGPGNLVKEGLGTLTLLNGATHTGGTIINAGTLQLGDGGTTGSLQGDVLNNATLAVNRSDLLVLNGQISGAGVFEQNGTGVTALTAANSYTGATTVNEGGLIVTGSIASSSSLTVNPGAFAGGTGTLPSTIVGGALSPGLSIGTIQISGNLSFVGAGNYIVEVSPTTADRTNVTGSANLAGTLTLVPTGGTYTPGRQYVLLNADGGVNGTFATGDLTGLFGNAVVVSVSYDPNNVFLNFAPNTIAQFLPADAPTNARNVAAALDAGFLAGNASAAFLSLFNLTAASLPAALAQISGEVATGAAPAGFRSMDQFLNLMLDPFLENRAGGSAAGVTGPALAFAPVDEPDVLSYGKRVTKALPQLPSFEQRWTVWGAAYGGQGSFDGDAAIGSHGLDVRTGGVAGGADYRFSPNIVAGVALSGNSLWWRLDGGLGTGKGDAVQAGLYGSTRFDKAYVSAALSFGWYDLETDRTVLLPGITDRLTADFSARSVGGRIESGYRVPLLQSSGVTPYGALQAMSFRTPAYSETNPVAPAAFALDYAADTVNDVHTELGLRFDSRFALTDTSILILRGRAAWAHAFDTDRAINAVFQALPVAGFTVFGASAAENAALLSAGGELRLGNGISLLAKFDGEFADGTQVYAGSGAVRYTW
jgi:autotransporter-associated beta strand protein